MQLWLTRIGDSGNLSIFTTIDNTTSSQLNVVERYTKLIPNVDTFLQLTRRYHLGMDVIAEQEGPDKE